MTTLRILKDSKLTALTICCIIFVVSPHLPANEADRSAKDILQAASEAVSKINFLTYELVDKRPTSTKKIDRYTEWTDSSGFRWIRIDSIHSIDKEERVVLNMVKPGQYVHGLGSQYFVSEIEAKSKASKFKNSIQELFYLDFEPTDTFKVSEIEIGGQELYIIDREISKEGFYKFYEALKDRVSLRSFAQWDEWRPKKIRCFIQKNNHLPVRMHVYNDSKKLVADVQIRNISSNSKKPVKENFSFDTKSSTEYDHEVFRELMLIYLNLEPLGAK